MLLRPDYLSLPEGFSTAALPPLVTVEKALEDQLAYVLRNVESFIVMTYPEGNKVWQELYSSMVIVLTAPNVWDGRQQNRMREAAVKAGLIRPDRRNCVRFVSEGEVRYTLNGNLCL